VSTTYAVVGTVISLQRRHLARRHRRSRLGVIWCGSH